MTSIVDFDLHGIVGIRLIGASASDVAAVSHQLGPIQSPFSREPDIVIKFQKRLHLSAPMNYLGVNDAGYTDDAFLVLRGKHKSPARVKIPIDQIGGSCEIICERGITAVPLLIAIVNLTMLGKGYLPLHASAFQYNGFGCLATGWAKGGKTEALLAFMKAGAAYVGDEWVYLAPNGSQMFGIPEPIRVWQWHLDHLPEYEAQIDRNTRMRLKALDWVVSGMSLPFMKRKAKGVLNIANRVRPLLKQQQYTHFPPHEFFGEENCPMSAPLDKVFFVLSHDSARTTIQPIDPDEISKRMLFSLLEEQQVLEAYYRRFRFAFPDHCNELLENAAERQRELLHKALAGKDSYVVSHPYPVPIPEMYQVMSPYLKEGSGP